MILIAHIVKYAQETLANYGELSWSHATRLEIQTLGRGGVQFGRTSQNCTGLGTMHKLYRSMSWWTPVGAGDWFTAVLVDRLCRRGVKGLISASKAVLFDAVNLAQRIAAWNCAYAGARGGMYSSEGRRELRSLARIRQAYPSATQYEVESDDAAAQICGCTIILRRMRSRPAFSQICHPDSDLLEFKDCLYALWSLSVRKHTQEPFRSGRDVGRFDSTSCASFCVSRSWPR